MTNVVNGQIGPKIQQFVWQRFPLARKRNLGPSDNLLESGVIDSMGVLELVGFIEQEFSILVSDDDLTPENFQNVDSIARFVERHTQAGS